MPAPKLDLYKEHRAEYAAKRVPAIVDVGPARYLAIEGRGAPEDAGFQHAFGALYAVAFTVKMARKLTGRITRSPRWKHSGGRASRATTSCGRRGSRGAGSSSSGRRSSSRRAK